MRNTVVGTTLLAVSLVSAAAGHAQTPRSSAITISRGSFAIAPFGGYLISQNFVEGPLSTTLGGVGAPLYGAQASLPLAPSASLIGTVGYSAGDLEVGLPIVGGISVGDNRTWVFDASVELRPDWDGRSRGAIPLLQFGGGAMRRELEVAGISARSTDFMVSAGVGADFPLAQNMSIRLMAKDYYGKADFGELGPLSAKTDDIHTLALSGGFRIAF